MTAKHRRGWPTRDRTLPLAGHLRELRRRLTVVAVAVLIAGVFGWMLTGPILELISLPVVESGAGNTVASINFDSVTSAFDLRLRIALQLALLLSAPVWLFQAFAFVVPGLTKRERRGTALFTVAAIPLFVAGCAAGVVSLPHIVVLMTSFAPEGSATLLQASTYYDFALKLILAVGIAFVLPVFLVVLNAMGLMSGTAILRGWRWAVLAIFVFTALVTPAADAIAMLLLALPMVALYFCAVGIAMLHDLRAAKRRDRSDSAAVAAQ